MVLDPYFAAQFIHGYKALLLEIELETSGSHARPIIERLVTARKRLYQDRSLLKEALNGVNAKNFEISAAVIDAIEDLKIEQWIYLRDTTRYSIFIHPKGHSAFGVMGLTDPIRSIVGGFGIVVEAGLVYYCGQFVCDGLISRGPFLGPNYRKSYAQTYRSVKADGHFYVTYNT
jgi:hypothetical protein